MRRIAATACLAALSVAALAGCNEDKDAPKAEPVQEALVTAEDYGQIATAFPTMPLKEGTTYTLCWSSVGTRNAAMMQAFEHARELNPSKEGQMDYGRFPDPFDTTVVVVKPANDDDADKAKVANAHGADNCFVVKYLKQSEPKPRN